MLNTFVMKHCC